MDSRKQGKNKIPKELLPPPPHPNAPPLGYWWISRYVFLCQRPPKEPPAADDIQLRPVHVESGVPTTLQ